MAKIRIAVGLNAKEPNLIRSIHLEGPKHVGDPNEFAHRYYEEGIDEIVYMDAVARSAGEILLPSGGPDRHGFDIPSIKAVAEVVSIFGARSAPDV